MVSNWLSNRMALTSSAFIAGAFLISGCGESGSPKPLFGSTKIDCANDSTVETVKSISIEQGIFLDLIKLNSPKSFRWTSEIMKQYDAMSFMGDPTIFWLGDPAWRTACQENPTCGKALDRVTALEAEIADVRKSAADAKAAADSKAAADAESGNVPVDAPPSPPLQVSEPPELIAEHRISIEDLRKELKKLRSSIDADWDRSSKTIQYTLTDIVTVSRNDELHSVGCKSTLSGIIAEWGGGKVQIEYTVEKTSDGDALVTLLGG